MAIRQQIITDIIEKTASQFGLSIPDAFVRYAHCLILGISTTSFDTDDLVEGGQDKQIDTVTIETDNESADVYISQITTSPTFSSDKIIKLANGLRWMFEASSKEYQKLSNDIFIDKIRQFRDIRSELGPSNLRIHVNFITLGSSKEISKEFKHELEKIRSEQDNDTYGSFTIKALGYDELIDLSKIWERRSKQIDEELIIRYDRNTPSLIRYDSEGLKGVVCSVPAREIARIVNDDPIGSIFDLNIRQFLGSKGKINRDILQTSTSSESFQFWFLNNGITIVCDNFDVVTDPDRPKVKLKNVQIVNGCQTATTIAAAAKQGTLKRGIYVLTRIYETDDQNLVSRIVLTTNSQNQISSRNLRANDPIQVDMEHAFSMNGYFYERKPRQYENKKIDINKIFDNEFVGQSYMAIILKDPSDARARKYKIWGELHYKVFSGKTKIESYILAALLTKQLSEWLRQSKYYKSKDSPKRIASRRGLFHIARIISYLWRGNDQWAVASDIKKQISIINSDPKSLYKIFEKAFQLLLSIIENSEYKDDPERGLKAGNLDKIIDKSLYKIKRI